MFGYVGVSFGSSLTYLSRRRKKPKLPQRKLLLLERPLLPLNLPLQNLPNSHKRNQKPTKMERTTTKALQLVPRAAKRRKRRRRRRRRSLRPPLRRRPLVSVR